MIRTGLLVLTFDSPRFSFVLFVSFFFVFRGGIGRPRRRWPHSFGQFPLVVLIFKGVRFLDFSGSCFFFYFGLFGNWLPIPQ